MSERRHVAPDGPGRWKVVAPGASRASSRHGTQAEAEQREKQILRGIGGGGAVIHRPTGEIRDADTVPPACDRTHSPTSSAEVLEVSS